MLRLLCGPQRSLPRVDLDQADSGTQLQQALRFWGLFRFEFIGYFQDTQNVLDDGLWIVWIRSEIQRTMPAHLARVFQTLRM